jgi:DNA ligase 1
MNYHKLFKKTATGATQVWWMEVVGGSYRTHSGQVDGQIVTSDWTEVQPKNVGRANATTPAEQAEAEAKSKYDRKRKTGYHESVEDAQSSDYFSPMLAKEFDEYASKIKLNEGVWVQPKLDGIRCIARASGLWSRNGDPIVSVPHIFEVLRPFFEHTPDLILDGELYNHRLKENFNEITSLVRKPTAGPEHFEITAEIIEYHIYDSPSPEGDYQKRLWRVMDVVDAVGPPLILVPSLRVNTRHALDAAYEMMLNDGYEGQMVRLDGPYENNKRSKLLLKRKEFTDSEFEILDIIEGVGNASGGAKIAVLRLDTDPTKSFKADVMGTKAERVEMLRNRAKLIGKTATVKYFKQRTPANIPRFGKLKVINVDGKW